MGWGDELQAAGEAQNLYDETFIPVAITDRRGRVRWSDLWDGNPAMATPEMVARGARVQYLCNAPNARPYNAAVPFTIQSGVQFTNWRARDHRGKLYLTDVELRIGETLRNRVGPYWVVEPSPTPLNPNKHWPFDRYEAVTRLGGRTWVQPLHAESRRLHEGAILGRATATFREACGLLSSADGFLGSEGGLSHAAAALGIPAVVIFGGCMSVETFGYPEHENLVDQGPETPCGRWRPCEHCREAMARIGVENVSQAILAVEVRPRGVTLSAHATRPDRVPVPAIRGDGIRSAGLATRDS